MSNIAEVLKYTYSPLCLEDLYARGPKEPVTLNTVSLLSQLWIQNPPLHTGIDKRIERFYANS